MIEKYRVNILYTAPTAIRTFIKWGDEWVDKYDLSSLRLLGTVGEGINPEAWMWYHRKIGGERCPIVDTWWQTETGGIMMTPVPGAIATKPGSCTKPLPGIVPEIVGEDRKPVPVGAGGWLTITQALAGDAPWHLGRRRALQDPVLDRRARQLSLRRQRPLRRGRLLLDHGPHRRRAERLGPPAEHDRDRKCPGQPPAVAEAAAVGRPHDIKGEAVTVFVTLASGFEPTEELRKELKNHVRKEIGALAVPDDIHFTASLPKTRSGKIMRRLLRDIAAGREDPGRHLDAGRLQRSGPPADGRGVDAPRPIADNRKWPAANGRNPRRVKRRVDAFVDAAARRVVAS